MVSFEQTCPHLARWVNFHGGIEPGNEGMSRSWLRALHEGGLVWEGGDASEAVDAAFQELDAALADWLRQKSFG